MKHPENLDELIHQMVDELKKCFDSTTLQNAGMIGIRTGGVWVANALSRQLGLNNPIGELDIAFYRDDFTRIGLNPTVKPSHLPFSTDNQHILLVDDVIMSGRTIRAAMNEIFDFGRPASITLITLIDIGQRELPIHPQVVGRTIHLAPNEQIKLNGPSPLALEIRKKG